MDEGGASSSSTARSLYEVGIERSVLLNLSSEELQLGDAAQTVNHLYTLTDLQRSLNPSPLHPVSIINNPQQPTIVSRYDDIPLHMQGLSGAIAVASEVGESNNHETLSSFRHRLGWLLLLLLLQSSSSVVLKYFETLIIDRPVIILFLTMLVGTGGNAGSQSTVLAIRNIAKGSFSPHASLKGFIFSELWIG